MSERAGTKVHRVANMTNAEFFEAYAGAGRVGLVGGTDAILKFVSRAQRRQTDDGKASPYAHAFLLEGRRADGKHWLLESDIDISLAHAQFGIQENRIDKYLSDKDITSIAILDFGLSEEQTQTVLGEGLELMARRTKYSLRELFGAYLQMRSSPHDRSGANPLEQDESLFCSAFVQHAYLKIGMDFAENVSTKLTSPHDLFVTPIPHTAWVLAR